MNINADEYLSVADQKIINEHENVTIFFVPYLDQKNNCCDFTCTNWKYEISWVYEH